MGLRAFSSQLLCEQVVGRGLRRVSYDFDENKMLAPEYVNIFGVPFSFIPHEGGVSVPRPTRPKHAIEPSKEKEGLRIDFPNILRVDSIIRSNFKIDYSKITPIEIDPNDTITEVDFGSVIENDVTPAAMTAVDLKKRSKAYRLQTAVFKVASRVYDVEKYNWRGNQFDFLAQLLRLTGEFIQSDKIVIKSVFFSQDPDLRNILIMMNVPRIVQHFWGAIKNSDESIALLSPVFAKEKPIRSTADMPTWWTSKPNEWHEKSHINFTVFDSTWEANNASVINEHNAVRAFAKNDHLGLAIKYTFRGVLRNYYPDYLIHLNNGDFLILEVKGQDSDENRAKRDFLNLWVKAVNQNGSYGKWHWAVVFDSTEIHDILNSYREFPTESFLPQSVPPQEGSLEVNSQLLSDYFDISISQLRDEPSVEKMVQMVMRTIFSRHMTSIVSLIKQAGSEAQPGFIDDSEIQEQIYFILDGIGPSDKRVFESRVRNKIGLAKHLEKRSLDYLIHSEFLNDMIIRQMLEDFSPYVLQLSRAVECELLYKVFIPFSNYCMSLL